MADDARRFLREFLMYRYSRLLLEVEKQYPMTAEQKDALYARILNVEWIDTVLESSGRIESSN